MLKNFNITITIKLFGTSSIQHTNEIINPLTYKMMKKKVLALVVCALGISTIGAFAQTESAQKSEQKTEQCCKSKEGKKQHKGDFAKGDRKKGDRGKLNPFNGIQLTADQQQKISDLRAAQKTQREADKKMAKEARKQEREKFNAEVGKILTPEQMTIYNENCKALKAKMHQKEAKERKNRHQGKAAKK